MARHGMVTVTTVATEIVTIVVYDAVYCKETGRWGLLLRQLAFGLALTSRTPGANFNQSVWHTLSI